MILNEFLQQIIELKKYLKYGHYFYLAYVF